MHKQFFSLLALGLGLTVTAVTAKDDPRKPADPAATIQGAGSTLAAPLYDRWLESYRRIDPKFRLQYAAVGSGEGVRRFVAGEVDFGASDVAPNDKQLATKPETRTIPTTAGMVVLAYNLPGLNGVLKLSRSNYAEIFDGKIAKWNDARIRASNPGLNLPDRNITLVVRMDSSGTTNAFTTHLSAINPAWRAQSVGNLVAWPGVAVPMRGNEGVAGRIKISEGAIGYIEYSYAKRLRLPMAQLENKAGRYVAPDERSGAATLAANIGRIPANLRITFPDPEGEDSYPLVTLSYVLLNGQYADAAKGGGLKQFVNWGLGEGQRLGSALGFIPLPAPMVELCRAALEGVRTP